MVLHYEGREARDVLYNPQATLDLVCLTKLNCRGATSAGRMSNALTRHGVGNRIDYSPTFAEIRASIDAGHPVILSIGQASHIVVVAGYRLPDVLMIKDPYGGFEWWKAKYPQRRNAPPLSPQQPRLLGNGGSVDGQGIAYSYGQNLTGTYAIFITGPAPVRQPAAVRLGAAGGAIESEGIRVTFPASTSALLADELSVSYTPLVSPTHSLAGLDIPLTAFQIHALQSGTTVTHPPVSYHIEVTLDPAVLLSWGAPDGETEAATEEASASGVVNSTILTQTPNGAARAVLMGWDPDTLRWEALPGRYDPATGQLVATVDHFSEFVVVAETEQAIYLPMITR